MNNDNLVVIGGLVYLVIMGSYLFGFLKLWIWATNKGEGFVGIFYGFIVLVPGLSLGAILLFALPEILKAIAEHNAELRRETPIEEFVGDNEDFRIYLVFDFDRIEYAGVEVTVPFKLYPKDGKPEGEVLATVDCLSPESGGRFTLHGVPTSYWVLGGQRAADVMGKAACDMRDFNRKIEKAIRELGYSQDND